MVTMNISLPDAMRERVETGLNNELMQTTAFMCLT